MNTKRATRSSYAGANTNDLLMLLVDYRWRWIIPAVFIAAGVGVFAFLSKDTWEVSQSIIVRNHAVSGGVEPGEFRGVDSMRIVSIGYGESYPIASNDTPAGREQNRRVDLLLRAKAR